MLLKFPQCLFFCWDLEGTPILAIYLSTCMYVFVPFVPIEPSRTFSHLGEDKRTIQGTHFVNMNELEETRYLKDLAKNSNLVKLLSAHEARLVAAEEEAKAKDRTPPMPAQTPPNEPLPAAVRTVRPVARADVGRVKFEPIDDFAWDQGGHNSEFVTIYVNLDGVGSVKDNVKCEFTSKSFDLTVRESCSTRVSDLCRSWILRARITGY